MKRCSLTLDGERMRERNAKNFILSLKEFRPKQLANDNAQLHFLHIHSVSNLHLLYTLQIQLIWKKM